MNSLIHLIALLLATWGTWYFLDASQTVIGLAVGGFALLLVVWTIQAFVEDTGDAVSDIKERRRVKQGRRGR